EDGLGFEDNALLDSDGDSIASVGETLHGGGGYFGDRRHIGDLAGGPIPGRCIPDGDGDRFALIYDVEAGPFEWASRPVSYPLTVDGLTELRLSVPEPFA